MFAANVLFVILVKKSIKDENIPLSGYNFAINAMLVENITDVPGE